MHLNLKNFLKIHISCMSTQKKLIAWKDKKVICRCNNYTDMTELTHNKNEDKHELITM